MFSTLTVWRSPRTRPDKFWMVFDVKPDGTLASGRTFLDVNDVNNESGDGAPDGMKVDEAGNLYATAVLIISPEGRHLGTIELPEISANCAWGEADGKTLYMTAFAG